MYSVFYGDLCIYDDISTSDTVVLVDPKLTLADNAAGSFSFTMPPTNAGYSTVERMKGEISVKKHDNEIWAGRVLTEEKDYWNRRKLTCEGELAYLNDILQPPASYDDQTISSFLRAVIAAYNERATASRRFTVGYVYVDTYARAGIAAESIDTTTNYASTFDVIKNELIDVYGGHLRIRKSGGVRYLDYLEDYPNTNSQEIDFHQNLVDFTRNWDDSEFCTVVIPYGKKIEDENDGKTGLAWKIEKKRNDNHTFNAEFKFTFNNPGVPSDYYVDEHDDDGNVIGQRLGSYDHNIWFEFWIEGDETHKVSLSNGEFWTMKAGADTNKTWNYVRENLIPNTSYCFRAWVRRWRSTGGGGAPENHNMGGAFDTGVHTFTVSLTDGEVDGIEKHVTVESVNNGSKYVQNQNGVTNYGWIEKVVEWDFIKDASTLLSMANWYLTDYQFDGLVITLSALDMHYFDINYEAVKLLDEIRVISTPHGLDKIFPVTKLEIPLDRPENTVFTLGDKERDSFTSSNNSSKSNIYEKLTAMPTRDDMSLDVMSSGYRMLVEAQQRAGALIEEYTSGYITIATDENGANALWITPTRDYTAADKWWKWTMGGLGFGYIDHNDNDTIKYKVAITMNGEIVADFITAGTMSVDRIRLYGLMGVYDQAVSSEQEVPGGYIGFGKGLVYNGDGTTTETNGIMISNTKNVDEQGRLTPNRRYLIATSAGVRINAGSQSFYLTDDTIDGQTSGTGYLGVSNTFTFKASGLDIMPSVVTNPNTGQPYGHDTAESGEVYFGYGKLILNKGIVVGHVNSVGIYDNPTTVLIGKKNVTVHKGVITNISDAISADSQTDFSDLVEVFQDLNTRITALENGSNVAVFG